MEGFPTSLLLLPAVGETRLSRADFVGARDNFVTAVAEYDDRESL
jgi:hypothetical protein